MHILLGGERHFITADRQQILDLLISTYEEAVHLNEDLKAREEQLARSNRPAYPCGPAIGWLAS